MALNLPLLLLSPHNLYFAGIPEEPSLKSKLSAGSYSWGLNCQSEGAVGVDISPPLASPQKGWLASSIALTLPGPEQRAQKASPVPALHPAGVSSQAAGSGYSAQHSWFH